MNGSERFRQMSTPVQQLRSEIAFWREMLKVNASGHSEVALERMRFALGLAERRLQALDPGASEGLESMPDAGQES